MKPEHTEVDLGSPTKEDHERHAVDEEDWSASSSEGLLGSRRDRPSWRKKEFWLYGKTALRLHAAIFCFYLLTIIGLSISLGRATAKIKSQFLYSPANEAVDWSVQEFNSGDGLQGDFIGVPRPALEKAWGDLLEPMNIRFTYKDVAAFHREDSAVAMTDGSGYVGTLNVYHELHCVRWLHKYIYQDEYWPGISEEQKKKNKSHSNHCLNALRKFAMCHGDVGLIVYSWQPDTLKPGANGTAHQCVDWPRLAKWSKERTINIYKPGLLIHPTLGPVYPDGDPNAHGSDNHDLHEPSLGH